MAHTYSWNAADGAGTIGRIPIFDLSPQVSGGRWPAKAFQGEVIPFAATATREGHDLIGVTLVLTDPSGDESDHPMSLIAEGTDRWRVTVSMQQTGLWQFRIRAFADDYASWLHTARIKLPAGQDVPVTLALGAELFARAAAERRRSAEDRAVLAGVARSLGIPRGDAVRKLQRAQSAEVRAALERSPIASLVTQSEKLPLDVERERAGRGAWYEFFPRSEGAVRHRDGSWRSGTFHSAAKRLPAIAEMGFDVVYLPPIHPIGRTFRKGPNNAPAAGPNDPGSPWAIGSAEGGHDAIHPELGTERDFRAFVSASAANGLEVAIDLALQTSPDHPWVAAHPEWFTVLPDGTIAYAENPPKKYQDIYPINFDRDPDGIRAEVLRIVRHWIALGVRIFRVDNPHTKPLDFWEWLIREVRRDDPDIVFLAEAFTRPAMLQGLAKIGFQQSYNYFPWRNTRIELETYLTELSHGTDSPDDRPQGSADYLRPSLWVNTPDILTEYLQFGGRAAYLIRAAIAATGAPLWGMYSGYELIENVARAGSEENVDNEKFEFKPRNWARAERAGSSIAPYIRQLNQIRRANPALGQLRGLHVHSSDDDRVLVYSRFLAGEFTPDGAPSGIIVVANLDPHSIRETYTHLDLTALGLANGSRYTVTELLTEQQWNWGNDNWVRLDAFSNPVHILAVHYPGG